MKLQKSAFSLLEIIIGLTIISIILVSAFQVLGGLGIGKVKLMEKTNIQKEAYFMSEKLFELIKKGGYIDYEEYWNRFSYNATTFDSGHYAVNSGFGNQGTRYSCMSSAGTNMGTGGCLSGFNIQSDSGSPNISYANQPQLYKSYMKQFIDYNADADADLGNEDASSQGFEDFVGDDDDLFLGLGPDAFLENTRLPELYLINSAGTQRTYFRWHVTYDPYDPTYDSVSQTNQHCDFSNAQFPTGTGCLGTIQILKLTGVDAGYNHGPYANNPIGGQGDDDGIIDTWLIEKDFDPNYGANAYSQSGVLAGSNANSYWQNIFPDTIHVSEVGFYIFPNVDAKYAWKDTALENQIAPYIQLQLTLEPSQKQKRKITGKSPQVKIATTIHLSDLHFQP